MGEVIGAKEGRARLVARIKGGGENLGINLHLSVTIETEFRCIG
jgi:hypothetical protein